jgi:hypothetical protein
VPSFVAPGSVYPGSGMHPSLPVLPGTDSLLRATGAECRAASAARLLRSLRRPSSFGFEGACVTRPDLTSLGLKRVAGAMPSSVAVGAACRGDSRSSVIDTR